MRTTLSPTEVQTLAGHARQLVAWTQAPTPISFGGLIAWMVELTLSLGLLRPTLKNSARLRRRLADITTPRPPRVHRRKPVEKPA